METFIAIIFIVFGLLQIILFFKIWEMTNDIRDIRNKYITGKASGEVLNETPVFKKGDKVINIKTCEELFIGKCSNGKYKCYADKELSEYVDSFHPQALERI